MAISPHSASPWQLSRAFALAPVCVREPSSAGTFWAFAGVTACVVPIQPVAIIKVAVETGI